MGKGWNLGRGVITGTSGSCCEGCAHLMAGYRPKCAMKSGREIGCRKERCEFVGKLKGVKGSSPKCFLKDVRA